MDSADWSPKHGPLSPEIPSDPALSVRKKTDESIADDAPDVPVAEPSHSKAIPSPTVADKWAVELPRLLVSTNLTLEKFHVLKWREIFRLSRLLAAPCFRRVRLAGDDHALYESFYRSFPHDMAAKARFTGVTRAVLGVEAVTSTSTSSAIATETNATNARELCRHLDKMQYAYELSSENVPMLNWRFLLVGLHLFQYPLLSLREHVAWGFRVFGSVGFLDALSDSTTIQTSDLALMLTQLMRNQACTRLVSERLRQAQVLQPTGTLTPANIRQRMSSTRVSHRRFQHLTTLAPLRALFDRATDHTIVLEEMATPIYRDLVYRKRKKDSDRKKIERLRYFHRTKRMRRAFFLWSETARVMKRTRVIMVAAFRRLARVKKAHGFVRLKRHAIQSWAATEIQRVVRGMIGRRLALDKWTLVQAAIKVQGAFRMRSHFVQFLKDMRRRHRAAIHVQRVYRGRVGRIAAKSALLAFYYREMEKIQHDRELFREVVRGEMARRIQQLFRAIVVRRREARAARDTRDRQRVELEMEDMVSKATREVRRHKMEVTAKYDKLREAHEYKQRRKQIDGVEKAKVIRLRRQRQWDAFKSERLATRERHKLEAAVAHSVLQSTWEVTIAERIKRKRLFISQVIELDEPGEWKALQKQLKAFVADREKELRVRYKQSQVVVPKQEVYDRAKIDIVDDEVEKERHAAKTDWLKAEAGFFHDLDVQEEERTMAENVEERKRRDKSAVLMQSAFRMFAAKKQLKAEIRQCFVKDFDTKTQLAMYRNTYSGDRPSARKPYGLGSDDLDFPDHWVLIDDDVVGQPFFYHPRTLRQSWEAPDECQCCTACMVSGKIAFAGYWKAEDDAYLCRSCYANRASAATASGEFNADDYYPYDGSKRGGY